MMIFIMLTRLAPTALRSPQSLEELERLTMEQIRSECPQTEWLANYAVLGPYDYVDVFRAPDLEAAMKIAALVRSYGHAHTEIWPAKTWREFKELVRHLPGPAGIITG